MAPRETWVQEEAMSAFPLAVLFTVGHQELAVFLDSMNPFDKYLWEGGRRGNFQQEFDWARGAPQWECPSEAERPFC